jgi:hypothetical protein
MSKSRVQPPVCTACGKLPWLCPSCGDYQCACAAPWTVQAPTERKRARKRMRLRQHYAPDGTAYQAHFIDGYELVPFPNEEEDEAWLEQLIASGPGL